MSRMIAAIEIEREFGVPADSVRTAIKHLLIEYQIVEGLISISIQDAEKIVSDYHIRHSSYAWRDVAKRFHVSADNIYLRKLLDSILPHYRLARGTYYPISDVEDVLSDMEHYHIRRYQDKYYYMEGSREDFYITNYFGISEFRQALEQKYNIRLKLKDFSKIESQLKKVYPVEIVDLFGSSEYRIPRAYMESLMEDYYDFYTVRGEEDPYERYRKEAAKQGDGQDKLEKTLELFDEFAKMQLSKTKNQMKRVRTLVSLRKYLSNTLDKEIYLYKNDEICDLAECVKGGHRKNVELGLFLKYVLNEYGEECIFCLALSSRREERVKTEEDFYTEEEWTGYIHFIFDIDLHIERAFSSSIYAKYWLYCMLQCSLAWRVEDILAMPSLQLKDIGQYSMEWFEQNEFTYASAWEIINTVKKFVEQNRVNKTGVKKHFIILSSFAVATGIGFIICEKHRQEASASSLFGKFGFHYGTMTKQLGPEIKGFSNLKAVRTILSFANETASHMEYSSHAISIASYMRSHIAGKSGFSDMTTTYLKSSFDERELLSLPAKMGELGLFGWLYNEILTIIDEKPKTDKEELIGVIKEDITPTRLEGYSGYLLQEQKKRSEIMAEIMEYDEEDLKALCTNLRRGTNTGKKEDVYCIKASCQHPTSQDCELCEYAVPSIHALHVIGQEASSLLDRLINIQGTDIDRERYSYQLFKLLTILKEAKTEFGEEFVSSFTDYGMIGEKLNELQNTMKGVE